MKTYTHERLARLVRERGMPESYVRDLRVVGSVLPSKVNGYVADELTDWSAAPDDPVFRLTFPHRDMLPEPVFAHMARLHHAGASRGELRRAAATAQRALNPHPGGQLESNVPALAPRPRPDRW